jgi:hypothetical protein
MKKNWTRAAGLVATTSMATAAIASGPWPTVLKVYALVITILIGARVTALADYFDGE